MERVISAVGESDLSKHVWNFIGLLCRLESNHLFHEKEKVSTNIELNLSLELFV
jgi:hypothetical protein